MKPSKDILVPIHDLINNRFSPRSFKNIDIPEINIQSFLEAARWAPSSMNEQPWFFIIGNKTKNIDVWQLIFDGLLPFNQGWAKDAPILLLCIASKTFSRNNQANHWAGYDLGQAVAYMTIQAESDQISMHQMGGFTEEILRTNLNIPDKYDIYTVLAIGYKSDGQQLPEDLKQREFAKQTRKPITELFTNNKL